MMFPLLLGICKDHVYDCLACMLDKIALTDAVMALPYLAAHLLDALWPVEVVPLAQTDRVEIRGPLTHPGTRTVVDGPTAPAVGIGNGAG